MPRPSCRTRARIALRTVRANWRSFLAIVKIWRLIQQQCPMRRQLRKGLARTSNPSSPISGTDGRNATRTTASVSLYDPKKDCVMRHTAATAKSKNGKHGPAKRRARAEGRRSAPARSATCSAPEAAVRLRFQRWGGLIAKQQVFVASQVRAHVEHLQRTELCR
jgi:hypothetical protein